MPNISVILKVSKNVATSKSNYFIKAVVAIICLEFAYNILDSFKHGMQTDVIYVKLSKVFDKISHDLLIFKLKEKLFLALTL